VTVDELAQRLEQATGREPLVFAEGPARIERVAVVTGGGGTRLIEAAHEGYDALVTGEPEEPALHTPGSSASTSWPAATTRPRPSV
jgi:putative NIF3 family GTP cyclohydrolase 1 type 2